MYTFDRKGVNMQKKLTVNEWLAQVGIDINKEVDIFEAEKSLSSAEQQLKRKCDKAKKMYSLKVLKDRLDNK